MPVDVDTDVVEKILGGFTDDPDAWSETAEDRYFLHTGWLPHVTRGSAYEIPGYTVTNEGERRYAHTWERFAPSERIADAWVVVEALRQRGHWVDIRDARPDGWRVSFGEEMTAHASSITEAICGAALVAVGEKETV